MRVGAVQRVAHRLHDVGGAHTARIALAAAGLTVVEAVEDEHLGGARARDRLSDAVQDERGADGGVERAHAVHDHVRAAQLAHHLRVGRREDLVLLVVAVAGEVEDALHTRGQLGGGGLVHGGAAAGRRVRDLILPAHHGAVLQLRAQRDALLRADDGQHQRALRDARHARKQKDGRLQRPEEYSGAREEKVADGAVGEVEALGGVAQDLRVEVHEEGADGVLVGVAHVLPQRVLALHNVRPLALGLARISGVQPVAQQPLDGERLGVTAVREAQAARADVAHRRAAQHTHDLCGAAAVVTDR
mmetsp:Transcript_17474/g.44703  ORF Transcript_17474/g.44703 Transcript_17474/m.44703 type:complete len:303 (-) Transcript_17474:768-1676(-)